MSVESEILRIQHNIANTYAAVADKGGTVPTQPTSANLAAAVASIPVGVTQEELSQALLTKQDKLVGARGQVVGFNAQGAAQAVQGWSNPNLLDNWYFADPINQRGKTAYSGPSGTYTIDRWKFNMNSELELLEGNEIKLSSSEQYGGIWQQLETSLGIMAGDTCTFSVLFSEVSAGWYIDAHLVSEEITIVQQNTIDEVLSPGIVSVTMSIPSSYVPKRGDYFRLFIANAIGSNITPCKIIATKLELAPIQTLARQDADGNWVLNDPPPNKALELAKCQRYQYPLFGDLVRALNVGTNSLFFHVPLAANLRAIPAVADINSAFIVRSLSGMNQKDFTFSITSIRSGGVVISATKTGHGMTDAMLRANGTANAPVILDANL